MDFLLKDEENAIEIKMTRPGLKEESKRNRERFREIRERNFRKSIH